MGCYRLTIQTTTLEILQSYRDSLTCTWFLVDYNRGEVRYIDQEGRKVAETIDSIIERTRQKADEQGYNFELIGGLYV